MKTRERIEEIEVRTLDIAARLSEIDNEQEDLYRELKFLIDARKCQHLRWDYDSEMNTSTCVSCGWIEDFYD